MARPLRLEFAGALYHVTSREFREFRGQVLRFAPVLPFPCNLSLYPASIRTTEGARAGNDQTAATGICRRAVPFDVSRKSA
jgi:hypothetical protein